MHGPSLSDHWYPARRAAATADPDDSPVNGPFLVDDSLLLFSQPNAQPSQEGKPACVPTQKTLSILAIEVIGSPQSLANRNASFTPARGITRPWRWAPGRPMSRLASRESGSFRHFTNLLRLRKRSRRRVPCGV